LPRGAVGRAFEAQVAFAPLAAACRDDRIPFASQVLNDVPAFGVDDQRARRHLDDEVLAVAAVTGRTAAALARGGLPVPLARESGQAVHAGRGHQVHVAGVAAVTPVG